MWRKVWPSVELAALLAALFCLASLLVTDFPPTQSSAFFPGHSPQAIGGSHTPARAAAAPRTLQALLGPLVPAPKDGPWSVALACFLVIGCPITSALIAYRAPSSQPWRNVFQLVAVASLLCYLLYFRWTYHAGLFLLGFLAWLLAAFHAHDLTGITGQLRGVIEQLGGVLNKQGLISDQQRHLIDEQQRQYESQTDIHKAYVSTALDEFYRHFYAAMAGAEEVLSVERFWTMERNPWVDLSFDDYIREGHPFMPAVQRIRDRSQLYGAIDGSKASRILFIGPMPGRNREDCYEGEDLAQLVSLIYTMCVLEISRLDNLKEMSGIRYQCAIADVPSWAKVIDNQYWLLQGGSTKSVRVLSYPPPIGRANKFLNPQEQADFQYANDRKLKLHHARTTSHRNLIDLYDRNAFRAYEHVCTLLLEFATRDLPNAFDGGTRMAEHLEALVHSIAGDEQGLRNFCKHYAREKTEPHHVLLLFRLFLALHFLEGTTLDRRSLQTAHDEVTLGALWERCA